MDGFRPPTDLEYNNYKSYTRAYVCGYLGKKRFRMFMVPTNMSMRYRKGVRYFLVSPHKLSYVQNGEVAAATFDFEYKRCKQFYCKEYNEILIFCREILVAGYVLEGTHHFGTINVLPPQCRTHLFNPHVDTDETWEPVSPYIKTFITRTTTHKVIVYYE